MRKYKFLKWNEYAYKINTIEQEGTWLLGEEKKNNFLWNSFAFDLYGMV